MKRCRSGFTIVEVLIVAAILTIVIAITMPALSYARTSAGASGSLANLRSQTIWLASYATEHRDELINPFAKRGPDQAVQRPDLSQPTGVPFLPDGFSPLYASLIGHDLADSISVYEGVFFAPLDPYLIELRESMDGSSTLHYRETLTPASYCYSSTMYQDDRRFRNGDGVQMTNSIRRRSLSEIAYPARKVAFHERADFTTGRTIETQLRWFEATAAPGTAFADGHVERIEVDGIYMAIEMGDETLQPAFEIDLRLAHNIDRDRHPFDFRSNGLFWTTRDGLSGYDVP